MIDQATLLVVLRGLHLASTLSLMGVLGFIAWILPAAAADGRVMITPLVRLWRISGWLALVFGTAWFVLQSAVIAGADSISEVVDALPIVAEHTRYGQTVLVRLALVLLVALLAGRSRFKLYLALLLAAVALALQGLIGHAGAIGGRIGDGIIASETLHLIAAGLWLGALIPLWICAGRLPPQAGALVCERFSPLGLGCVLAIAGSGLAQGVELIGSIPALVGTPYGRIACVKIGLFLVALVLAAVNRLWLTDRLSDAVPGARARLRLSVIIEAFVGLAIILTAAFLASHSPGIHDQPVWPFPWRFSLVTVDKNARWEIIVSASLIGLTGLVFIAACIWHRFRLLALALLAGMIAYRAPSFARLMVEAYPTSFQTSPTDFSAESIVHGQALYAENCVSCHGANGQGNGPAAALLRIKPTDLTMQHLWARSDGELFWWLTHGIDTPQGKLAMPGFPHLSTTDRWALIDYVRAHNAGVAEQQEGVFDVPVPAPTMPVQCDGLDASRSTDLLGHVVHVMADPTPKDETILPQSGISTISLTLSPTDGATAPRRGTCIAATPAAWPAYAILANVPADKLTGAAFLIGPNGWLRALHRPGSQDEFSSQASLIAAVREICANPIHPMSGGKNAQQH